MEAKGLHLSVAEIAAQVGYANQSKFAKVFREKDGVAPLEYRRTVHLGLFICRTVHYNRALKAKVSRTPANKSQ